MVSGYGGDMNGRHLGGGDSRRKGAPSVTVTRGSGERKPGVAEQARWVCRHQGSLHAVVGP